MAGWSRDQRRWVGSPARWALVVLLELVMVATLAAVSVSDAPVKPGNAAEFWYSAARVRGSRQLNLDGAICGTHPPQDGWFVYYIVGHHGTFLRRVDEKEVAAALPDALEALAKRAAAGDDTFPVAGYRTWLRTRKAPDDVRGLHAAICMARVDYLARKDPEARERTARGNAAFVRRWALADRYWVNIAFEFVYFTGLILFVSWPWVLRKGKWSWAIALALTPLLVLLPFYLGYAHMTFTSAWPVGGALYPRVARAVGCFGDSWSRIDRAILSAMPKFLVSITQETGPIISISGTGGGAPTNVAVLGLVAGLIPLAISWARAMKPRRGKARPANSAPGETPIRQERPPT